MSKPVSFYFGYGSNLSREQMSLRCPDCEYFISGKLPHYEWLINQRGYASIKPSREAFVLGEVFKLSNKDIEYLDIYENVSEGFYANDKPEGLQTSWDENGQIESEQEYKNGVLHGKSTFYEDGALASEYILKNGDVIEEITKNKTH